MAKIVKSKANTPVKTKPAAAKPVIVLTESANKPRTTSLQGIINPKLPINQIITTYVTEASLTNPMPIEESEEEEEEEEEFDVEELDEEAQLSNSDTLSMALSQNPKISYSVEASESAIGLAGRNVIHSNIRGEEKIRGQDCEALLRWKQGKGGSSLSGVRKRQHISFKEMKMVICTMFKSALNLQQCIVYLNMPSVNLKHVPGYQLLSADIVAHLVDLLRNHCGMENVRHGSVAEYFDVRFADTRNRKNYVPE
jgi:hypothetical protein